MVPPLGDWPIIGPSQKLLRANDHLEALEAVLDAWMALKPYRVWTERDTETGFSLIYAEPVGDIPIQVPTMIGDVLHNMRSSLDHAAYLIAEREYGGPLPEGFAGINHFPISKTPDQFAATRRSCIPHIGNDAIAIIESVQPYKSERGIDGSELTLLKELSDFDKHRSLPVVTCLGKMADPITVALGELSKLHLITVSPLKGKTCLGSYRIVPEPEMDMEDGFTFEVAFDEGSPTPVVGQKIQNVLTHLLLFIATKIIDPLKPYLE